MFCVYRETPKHKEKKGTTGVPILGSTVLGFLGDTTCLNIFPRHRRNTDADDVSRRETAIAKVCGIEMGMGMPEFQT